VRKNSAQFQANLFPILSDVPYSLLNILGATPRAVWIKMKIGNHHGEDAAAQKTGAARPYVGWIKLDWKFDGFVTCEASASSAARHGWKTNRGCQAIFQLPVSTHLMWIYGIISSPRRREATSWRDMRCRKTIRGWVRGYRASRSPSQNLVTQLSAVTLYDVKGKRGESNNFLMRLRISNFPWEPLSL